MNSPAIQFLALSYGASEFLLDFAQLAFLFSLADGLLHLFGVKLGSEQHLLVGGLDFKFEDVLSGKLIEPLFILGASLDGHLLLQAAHAALRVGLKGVAVVPGRRPLHSS